MFLYINCNSFTREAPEVVEKPGDNSLARLKMLYTQAKDLSESEVAYVYHYTALSIICFLSAAIVTIF